MGYPPTDEQQRIIDAAVSHKQIMVNAAAGTGKTSTLVLIAEAMKKTTITYLAFNSAIKEEAKTRFGSNVKCFTTHGLALRTNYSEWQRKMKIKNPRARGRVIAQKCKIYGGYKSESIDLTPADIGSLAWSMVDRFASSPDPDIGWWHLAASHVAQADQAERQHIGERIRPYAEKIWGNLMSANPVYPYWHQHYRKAWALTEPQIDTDVILFDEAQDTAPVVMGVLRNQRNSLIIPVGDRYQSINEFTGARNALDMFGGEELRLTQSFRFGPAIAEVANQFLDRLGTDMRVRGYGKIKSTVGPCARPDAILCRTNSGAMTEVFKALDAGLKVALQGDGREIGELAQAALLLQKGIRADHKDLRGFATWGEVQEYVENEPAGADLKTFVGLVDREGASQIIAAVDSLIKTSPAAKKHQAQTTPKRQLTPDVTVSTAHKAKGLEFPSVDITDDFPEPKQAAGDADPEATAAAASELKLAYVAVTRAKNKLDPRGVYTLLG